MKVILMRDYKKLGKVGELVTVKSGFGRNWLLPNKFAVMATKDNLANFEVKKAEILAENQRKQSGASAQAEKLQGLMVNIYRQAGEDGRLYGSVSARDIAEVVTAKSSIETDKNMIMISAPIKAIGIYPIEVHLFLEVDQTVLVNVSRSENEAIIAADKYFESLKAPAASKADEYTAGFESEEVEKPAKKSKKKVAEAEESEEKTEE